jgi:SAM-dependent methyltransferase
MPIRLNALERLLFFTLNIGPGPLLDIWSAVAFQVVKAAISLRVFDTLQGAPATADELAAKLSLDREGTGQMLAALETLGYVKKGRDGTFRLTPFSTKWLVRSSPTSFAAAFEYFGAVLPRLMHNVEESLRSGKPPVHLYEWIEQEPEVSAAFQQYMVGIARLTEGEILARLPMPEGAARLLDVGGGHALYSIALCRKYPNLTATVFDSPQALVSGRANIAAEHLEARIATQEGNFLVDDLGSGYDVALAFNIIGLPPDETRAVLARIAGALRPGGQIVIAEQFSGGAPTPGAAAISALLGVAYFHLLGGRVYTYEDALCWLEETGYAGANRIDLRRAPGVSLLVATKGQ